MFGDCIGKIIEMPIHYKRNIIIMNATKNDKREMLRKKTQNLVKNTFIRNYMRKEPGMLEEKSEYLIKTSLLE